MAGFKTFTAAVLTAADVNSYLMQQANIQCTSATRPTGVEGMVISETDTKRVWRHSGAAWVFAGYYTTAGRPGVILTDAAQSIVTATISDITWGTEVSDVDNWTSGGSATLTVPSGWDGQYAVSYSGQFAVAAGASQGSQCLINGATIYADTSTTLWNVTTIGFVRTFAATDTIKFQVFQNSGGNVNIVSRLEIAWLGR